ncbi:MAG TPA: urea ABC transporter permease subunit UrtC, partial [Fluviicoccus sp.]|nr:urea ABC transporter permease subunit UrtC [Fluviicoccus sp.]
MLTQRLILADRGSRWLLGLLALTTVLVPVLNLWVPADSALHLSTFTVTQLGKFLCFALLALSLDLIWGYCGILSLGHGAFFALGGYCMGMYLMRQIGTRGVYGNADLPDFMVFLNWETLPWYWHGFDMFWFAMLMVLAVPG